MNIGFRNLDLVSNMIPYNNIAWEGRGGSLTRTQQNNQFVWRFVIFFLINIFLMLKHGGGASHVVIRITEIEID